MSQRTGRESTPNPRKLRSSRSPRQSADLLGRPWARKQPLFPSRGFGVPSEAFGGLGDEDDEEQRLEPTADKRTDSRRMGSAWTRTETFLSLSCSWAENPLEDVRPRSVSACATMRPVDAQPQAAPPHGARELGQEASWRATWSHSSTARDTPDSPSWTLQPAPIAQRSPSRPPDVGEWRGESRPLPRAALSRSLAVGAVGVEPRGPADPLALGRALCAEQVPRDADRSGHAHGPARSQPDRAHLIGRNSVLQL